MDKFLAFTWFFGCLVQKSFGAVDDYYGAKSWDDALEWLTKQPRPLTSIQYWGHGSVGRVWLAQQAIEASKFSVLIPCVTPASIVWFRTCSTFQGPAGYDFSKYLSNLLNCTIAGHTRVIGLLQGGLHTRKPNTEPSWPVDEGELPATAFYPQYGLAWSNNTVTCFVTNVPEGW